MQFSFGYLHPSHMRYAGFIVMAISLGALLLAKPAALITLIVGYWLAFKSSGTEIDLEKRLYRPFTSSFGFKRGDWVSYATYPDIAVLHGKEGFTAYSRGMVELSVADTVYDIYLLSEDHRKRLILTRCKSAELAEKDCQELAKKLGLRCTAYAPKLSERTKGRRR